MACLFLIPTPLSVQKQHHALLDYQVTKIKHLKHFIVETAKVARAHIKMLGLNTPLQELNINELNKHTKDLQAIVKPLLQGIDVGLMSDCGLPAIADPGSQIVKIAHQNNIAVYPLIGPSSLFLALMASGINGQNFTFNGYLPIDKEQRRKKLNELQKDVLQKNISQIFIETPFRCNQLFRAIIDSIDLSITLTLAINLSCHNQQILSYPIRVWQNKTIELDKQEVVFILGQ